MENIPKQNNLHPIIQFLYKVSTVILSVIGLMKITSTKIEWSENTDQIVKHYENLLSIPLHSFFQKIAALIGINIDWIPSWTYDYIPIACIFSFALLMSNLKRNNTTILQECSLLVQDCKDEIKKKGRFVGIGSITFFALLGFVFFLFFAFTSPLFVIIYPLTLILIYGVVFFLGFAFYSYILYGLLVYILPTVLVLYLIVAIYYLVKSKQKFNSFVFNQKKFWNDILQHLKNAVRSLIKRIFNYFRKGEMNKDIDTSKNNLISYFHLIKNQYINASIVLLAFILVLILDYNFRGYNLVATIKHIWSILEG